MESFGMANRRKKTPPIDGPEFIVSREFFDRYFERPLPPSTFFDRVDEGKILRWPHIQGKFYLNASLQRLGLPTEKELPKTCPGRSLEDICRLAFTILDPILFPAPPWLLNIEAIDSVVADHATRLADQYRDKVAALGTPEEKLAYFGGALDAQFLIEADT
jgi:hypothetical protein